MTGHAYHAALADVKRGQVVVAAQRLFLERGFSRTSMADVAELAGVSSATVYRHFESKVALFQAVVEALIDRFARAFAAVSLPSCDLPGGLKKFAEAYAALLHDEDVVGVARLIIAEAPAMPEPALYFMQAMKGPVSDSLRAFLGAAAADGRLRPHDPHHAVNQFLGHMDRSLLFARLLNPSRAPIPGYREQVVDATVEAFLRAYDAPAPST